MEKKENEVLWIKMQLEKSRWTAIDEYVEDNYLDEESLDFIADTAEKEPRRRTRAINFLSDYAENFEVPTQKALIALLKYSQYNDWIGEIDTDNLEGLEHYMLLNKAYERNRSDDCDFCTELIDYIEDYGLSENTYPEFAKFCSENMYPDLQSAVIKAFIDSEREDEILDKVADANLLFINHYFREYKELPVHAMSLLFNDSFMTDEDREQDEDDYEDDNKPTFWKTIYHYDIVLSEPQLSELFIKHEAAQALEYLSNLVDRNLRPDDYLSPEDQTKLLQREGFDQVISIYNATHGFDTEVLEENNRPDLLINRPKFRNFPLTKEQRALQEEEERKQRIKDEEEQRQRKIKEEEEERKRKAQEEAERIKKEAEAKAAAEEAEAKAKQKREEVEKANAETLRQRQEWVEKMQTKKKTKSGFWEFFKKLFS